MRPLGRTAGTLACFVTTALESRRRALFLDRDGVINVDHGYVFQQENFEFIDGVFDLCRAAIEHDYLVVVVTNQAGIGRGYYTEQQFHDLNQWMCAEFMAQGVAIAGVYFCPFHPEHGIGPYKRRSDFRKPGPGMIFQAAREHDVDLANSILVGDKRSDIEAGLAAGVGCNVLYSPQGDLHLEIPAAVIRSLRDLRQLFFNRAPKYPEDRSIG